MSFNLSALWKSHTDESVTERTDADLAQASDKDRTRRYAPSDMAFLDEEDIKRLSVFHHRKAD